MDIWSHRYRSHDIKSFVKRTIVFDNELFLLCIACQINMQHMPYIVEQLHAWNVVKGNKLRKLETNTLAMCEKPEISSTTDACEVNERLYKRLGLGPKTIHFLTYDLHKVVYAACDEQMTRIQFIFFFPQYRSSWLNDNCHKFKDDGIY